MSFLYLTFTIIFGLMTYFLHFRFDHDFHSIKLYQNFYDQIKSKGLGYDEYMRLYWKVIKYFKYTLMGLTCLSFILFLL